jgi:hypothetical protein
VTQKDVEAPVAETDKKKVDKKPKQTKEKEKDKPKEESEESS